jgi:hypothetical protein
MQMFRNYHKQTYVEAFAKACQSDQPSSVDEARRILILSSTGHLQVKHLMNDDGSCKSLKDVCMCVNVVKKARYWRTHDDVDVKSAKMVKVESQKRCDQRGELSASVTNLVSAYGHDVKLFRREVLKSKGSYFAIHFFTWYGRPRTVAEIARALCLYSRNASMLKSTILALAVLAGLMLLGSYEQAKEQAKGRFPRGFPADDPDAVAYAVTWTQRINAEFHKQFPSRPGLQQTFTKALEQRKSEPCPEHARDHLWKWTTQILLKKNKHDVCLSVREAYDVLIAQDKPCLEGVEIKNNERIMIMLFYFISLQTKEGEGYSRRPHEDADMEQLQRYFDTVATQSGVKTLDLFKKAIVLKKYKID